MAGTVSVRVLLSSVRRGSGAVGDWCAAVDTGVSRRAVPAPLHAPQLRYTDRVARNSPSAR